MEYTKQFLSLFEKPARRYGGRQVFDDFVALASIALSQGGRRTVGLPQDELDEQTFLKIEQRYGQDEIQGPFADLFKIMINGLEHEKGDWLGNIYGGLRLGNTALGQFFTPFPVAKFMAQAACGDREAIQNAIDRKGYLAINEPACGAGSLVIACAETFREAGFDPSVLKYKDLRCALRAEPLRSAFVPSRRQPDHQTQPLMAC
jgi:hypothetical protein